MKRFKTAVLSAAAFLVTGAASACGQDGMMNCGHRPGGALVLFGLLIALAAGYGVLVLSQGQPRPLDKLGRLIGGLILVVSFVALIAGAVCGVHCLITRGCASGAGCPMMSKKACHMTMDAPSPTPQP